MCPPRERAQGGLEMKNLKFVPKAYKKAVRRELYTKRISENRRLNIIARPIKPLTGYTPLEVAQAFKSVIMWGPYFKGNTLFTPAELKALCEGTGSDSERAALLDAVKSKILSKFPELKDDPRTASICPIITGVEEEHLTGHVLAWDAADAHTVAEYLAGGCVSIYLEDLYESSWEVLGSDWLGHLSYSDVTGDTDAYRRVVEGENLVLAMEEHLGVEFPEPEDSEYPGTEILATFTKLP